MAQVELQFASLDDKTELIRWEYRYSHDTVILEAERRHTTPSSDSIGSFRWTAAVRALSSLFVKAALCLTQDLPISLAEISGGRKTPVASLDDALYKKPNWLDGFFGEESTGLPRSKDLFIRTNPGLKRAGPVSISLNENLLSPLTVRIFFNEKELLSTADIYDLSMALNLCTDKKKLSVKCLSEHSRLDTKKEHDGSHVVDFEANSANDCLFGIYFRELSHILRKTNIFSKTAVLDSVNLIRSHPSIQHIISRSVDFVHETDFSLLHETGLRWHCYDNLRNRLDRYGPFRIWASPAQAGAIVIMESLIKTTGLNIEIHWEFAHALDIVSRIMHGNNIEPPHAIIMNIGSVASLLGGRYNLPYQPFMRMPHLSQGVVTRDPKLKKLSDIDVILSMTQEPSSVSFLVDELIAKRDLGISRDAIREVEPKDIPLMLAESESGIASILWFPFYALNAQYNECHIVPTSASSVVGETFLCLRKDSLPNDILKRELSACVRNAWLGLLEDERLLENTIKEMLASSAFKRFLRCSSGLFNMNSMPNCQNL